jgi:predicted permease
MSTYLQLLSITLPVFALFALGMLVRRIGWFGVEAETSVLKLIVNLFYPCLIFRSVLGNAALREPGNVVVAPLVGFLVMVLGMLVGLYAAKLLGLVVGRGLRTFAFAVGITNYGYIAIPLVEGLWGREHLGLLMVFNVGVEVSVWTFGILLLSGLSPRDGWKKLLNPVVISLLVGVALNLMHLELPSVPLRMIDALAACAIPLGLLAAGAAVEPFLASPADLFEAKTSLSACLLRLGLLPLAFLAIAYWAPVSLELKRVLVVQAAMPSGMFPLVLSRHYGGQPIVAARVILATTLLGLVVIPLWIAVGIKLVG